MFSVQASIGLSERLFYRVCRTTLTPIANYAFYTAARQHSNFAVQSQIVV
jgi:hypothetical protein